MEKFYAEIKADSEVNEFISKLSKEEIDDNLCLLLAQARANKICSACKGKGKCQSDLYLMQSRLIKSTNIVSREYFPCPYQKEGNLELLFFPDNVIKDFSANKKLYKDIGREDIVKAIHAYKKNPSGKGIYVYGSFGTGKTYLMLRLAQDLAKEGRNIIFVYYPELTRMIKASIAANSLDALIVKLKQADILILDDIGGEYNTSFVRDEILGPILQFRMVCKSPVFMTSNLGIDELKQHLASTKDERDVLKAARIIERIKYMTDVIEIKGQNYRIEVQ